MNSISVVLIALALLGACSCKKSKEGQLAADSDNAAETVRVALTNWVAENRSNSKANTQIMAKANMIAEDAGAAVTNKVLLETFAAGDVLKRIHDQGHLPGVSKDEHGYMSCDAISLVVSNKPALMTYPALRIFHHIKDGETSTNNYMLVKQSKDSEWKLQKAWETDSKGQIIQEWPVK